jgi:hypothetical protein
VLAIQPKFIRLFVAAMGKDSDIKYDPEQYKNVVPNWYLPEERKSIYLPIDYEVGMNYTRNE